LTDLWLNLNDLKMQKQNHLLKHTKLYAIFDIN